MRTAIFRSLFASVVLVLGLAAPAWAHKASDAYLQLTDGPAGESVQATALSLSVALRDIDLAIDTLDLDNNRELDWGEIKQRLPDIQAWIQTGLHLQCAGQDSPVDWTFASLEQRSDGIYTRWATSTACPTAQWAVRYQLLKDEDATHRLLVGGMLRGQALATVVSPQTGGKVLLAAASGAAGQSVWATLAHFFPEGVHHIATGYDHLAFLLALLLPISLRRTGAVHTSQQPSQATHHTQGVKNLLRTVTGFTLGHSATLVLASLGFIGSPAWVEPMIAITIAISAGLNLYPVRWLRGDALALGFGLVHGLGFSNIMREAQVDSVLLPWALAGFNLGVEAGQLVGVLLWCAVHMLLAGWRGYHAVVVRGGSWALMALALFWTAQRL
jgi:HupE / UreJ protein